MKTILSSILLLILVFSLSGQNRILVDCIHGADYRVGWESYEPEAIDFEAYFPDFEVDVFTADSLEFIDVFYDETHNGNQQLDYQITMPEMVPGNSSTLYVVVQNSSGSYLINATGTITNPDGDIVSEMFNGVLHFDEAYGAGWSVQINLPEPEGYHIKIGWGGAMFAGPFYLSQCHLEDYDAVLKIADQSYLAFLGNSPDYSDMDRYGLTMEMENGVGFLMINNFFDAFMDKPFVHFRTNEQQAIDFQVSYPGATTIASPYPKFRTVKLGVNTLKWRDFNLNTKCKNEIVYEAKLNNRLNFLGFDFSGNRLILQNRIENSLDNIKLFCYVEPGFYSYSETSELTGFQKVEIIDWQQISSSMLKSKLKLEFYEEALQAGLYDEEAYNFVYDYNWIETLLQRAFNNPGHYFGIYHFGNDLYDKLVPYRCEPEPTERMRNMWVMLSGIQARAEEDIIVFPESIACSGVETDDFVLNEYGVIDEYFSRENSSRDLEFFGIQESGFIGYWMMNGIEFYDNEIASAIAGDIYLDAFYQGHYSYNINDDINGLIRHIEMDSPIAVYSEIQPENRIIVLGSDEYFSGDETKKQILSNMLEYVCSGSVSGVNDHLLPVSDYQLTCHPNPFNPVTTISFSFSSELYEQDEQFAVEVYNVKGQKVVTLSDCRSFSKGSCIAGQQNHSITWNGTDMNNNPVSSGIYLYQLKIGDEVKVQSKMLLLK